MAGERYYFLGTIIKTYGVNGELVLSLKDYLFDVVTKLTTVFIDIDGQQVPFFIDKTKPFRQDSIIIKLESIDNLEDAHLLVHHQLYTNSPYYSSGDIEESDLADFVGFTLYGEVEGEIGKIVEVYRYPENPVLQIIRNGKEVLIPINTDLLIAIDLVDKRIVMRLPNGLMDLSE